MVDYKSIVKYFYELILCEFTDIDCWVGGGSILSFLDKREMYDIDLYFSSEEERTKCVSYLLKNGGVKIDDNEYTSKFSYNNKSGFKNRNILLDLIKVYYNNPTECMENEIDFSVCAIATDGMEIYKVANFENDFLKRRLIFNNIQNTFLNMIRVVKYTKRGYSISEEELLKLYIIIKHRNFIDTNIKME